LKVTSVSKKEELLSGAAAAISVITAEDIRRSGVTEIPDALRLAPGVNVGRVDAHQWAVGVRGLNDTFSSSLLTLVDGRSIYSPAFSGTFWMAQDVMLEDVDRIEVIRGPGASIWGANAFNGVINIVNKPANETQGLLLAGGSGSQQLGATSARYGGQLGENTFYRVYGKYDTWDRFEQAGGTLADDQWWKVQGGFRLDHAPSDVNNFTLQGDVYHLSADQVVPQVTFTPPYQSTKPGVWDQTGGNLMGRWTHQTGADSEFSVQAYYDGEQLDMALMRQTRNTFDLDLRDRFHLGSRQEIVWGGGYRLSVSDFAGSFETTFLNQHPCDQIFNTFVQDELTLVPDRLRFTLGTKLEHNNYTGWEVEPSARLAWTPSEKQTVWASVSRAVRTPSQIEDSGRIRLAYFPPSPPSTPGTLIEVTGNNNFAAEQLTAYELGYRLQPHPRVTFDVAGFVHSYRGLRGTTESVNMSSLPAYLTIDSMMGNTTHGETYGTEISSTWQVFEDWRLSGNYSLLESHLAAAPSLLTTSTESVSTRAPVHQVSLRSSLNVTKDVDFDLWLRYASGVADTGVTSPGLTPAYIPGYFTMDARIAWRPTQRLELSIVGQNLFDSPHREFNPTFLSTQMAQITCSVFAKVPWRF